MGSCPTPATRVTLLLYVPLIERTTPLDIRCKTVSITDRMEELMLLYSRELPGGGLVTIETTPEPGAPVRARVAVERRGDPKRRDGHTPPVIAEMDAPTRDDVFQALYPIASDNVAVARGLIQWQARRRAD